MAKIIEWTPAQQQVWNEWVESRPLQVKALCLSHPADRLYRLKSSGHRVTITAYHEDGTMIVDVSGHYNAVVFRRSVFGIHPENLTECELPNSSERCGVLLNNEQDIQLYFQMNDKEKRTFIGQRVKERFHNSRRRSTRDGNEYGRKTYDLDKL